MSKLDMFIASIHLCSNRQQRRVSFSKPGTIWSDFAPEHFMAVELIVQVLLTLDCIWQQSKAGRRVYIPSME